MHGQLAVYDPKYVSKVELGENHMRLWHVLPQIVQGFKSASRIHEITVLTRTSGS
jgi:hypothetical protein